MEARQPQFATTFIITWIIVGTLTVVSVASLSFLLCDFARSDQTVLSLLHRLASDRRLLSAVVNTALFGVIALAVQLSIGLALALLLGPLPRAAKLFLLLPSALPAWTAAVGFFLLLSPSVGLVTKLTSFGDQLTAPLFTSRFGIAATVVVIDSWQWLPFTLLVISVSLDRIKASHVAQARLEGASGLVILARVIVPQLRASLAALLVLRAFDLLRIFDVPALLFGIGGTNSNAETISIYLYRLMFQSGGRAYAALISALMAACLVVVMVTFRRQLARLFLSGGRAYV